MDKIDELIESVGDNFTCFDECRVIYKLGEHYTIGVNRTRVAEKICTVGEYKDRLRQKYEYKERLQKQQLIKLIESACTDDAASIANVIIRNGWVKK